MSDSLKDRALKQLRQWRETGRHDEVYAISKLAEILGCTEMELFDWNNDSGVLVELIDEGLVGRSGGDCVYAQGGGFTWEWF